MNSNGIILWLLLIITIHDGLAQTIHHVSVALHQGTGCPGVLSSAGHNSVMVYPNPAKGKLTVTNARDAQAILIDVQGKRVDVQSIVTDKHVWDVSQILSGIYFIHLGWPTGRTQVMRIKIDK